MPYFNCPDVEEKIRIEFPELVIINYEVDNNLEPINSDGSKLDWRLLDQRSLFYYVNYFGLKSNFIESELDNCLIDNAHSFFSKPVKNNHTIYSARKFFGVPDGAYLSTSLKLSDDLDEHDCRNAFSHLLGRQAINARKYYHKYMENEKTLAHANVRSMSKLSQTILSSIDYELVRSKRVDNFYYLHSKLEPINLLSDLISDSCHSLNFSPLSYPLLLKGKGEIIRKFLIDNGIYVPSLWRRFIERDEPRCEFKNIIHIPIDQRYCLKDMKQVLGVLKSVIKEI
ncbi:hypothetical protein [Vibrio mexicanus]|uniref:hypothetical protein n=1 Tax=Vibrio mexicanus TaxID=1004326 RepID=UPI0012F7561A|nr:hypothetical protein [Vibrio mexicanus]